MLVFGPLVTRDTTDFAFGAINDPKTRFSMHFHLLLSTMLAFGPLVARDMTGFAFGAVDDPGTCILTHVSHVSFTHVFIQTPDC